MRLTKLGVALVAGVFVEANPAEIPSAYVSLIPSFARSYIPSSLLPTDTPSPAAVPSAESTVASPTGAPAPTAAPFVPPPFTTNPALWASIYQSIQSNGLSWPSTGWGPGSGPWGPGGPWGQGRGPPSGQHWGGPDGCGPWGQGNWGPSEWSTRTDWRNGPWTAWWGGSACPGSDWPGWTQGPWGTAAPWTSWANCSASTTATSVVTTTVSGAVTTSTQYGIQVAEINTSGSVSNDATASAVSQGAAPQMKSVSPRIAIWAAVFGLAVGL